MRFVELCLVCFLASRRRVAAVLGQGELGRWLIMSGIACYMTAGARGTAMVPFVVVAGVIKI